MCMNDIALAAFRSRMTGVFPAQVRAALASLTDEQLWWRPNEKSNSIGPLPKSGSFHGASVF